MLLFSIKFCLRALNSLVIHYLLSALKNTNLLKVFPLKHFFAFYLPDRSQTTLNNMSLEKHQLLVVLNLLSAASFLISVIKFHD